MADWFGRLLGMDKLNKRQRIAVWVMLILAVGMLLYSPEAHYEGRQTIGKFDGDGTFFAGGGYEWLWENEQVNAGLLFIQYLVLAGIGWAVVTSLKEKRG